MLTVIFTAVTIAFFVSIAATVAVNVASLRAFA